MSLIIEEEKDVWLVIGNSDLTEGRGHSIIMAICETEATAKRIGSRKYVQGSDCPIEKSKRVKINGNWYSRSDVVKASDEDLKQQALADEKKELIEKAKSLGLSDAEISKLSM